MTLADLVTRWFRKPTMVEYLTVLARCTEPASLEEVQEQLARTMRKPLRKQTVAVDLKELEKQGLITRRQYHNRPPKWYRLSVLGHGVLARVWEVGRTRE